MHPSRILFWSALFFLCAIFIFTGDSSREEYTQKKEASRLTHESQFKLVFSLREWFLSSIWKIVPEPVNALVGGVLIGDRSELPKSIVEDFRRTGLSHITAVSGYNINIIAVVLMNVLASTVSRRKAFWIVLGILGVFMILTGLQASVIRATIMGLFALFAQQLGRVPTPMHALAIAAAVMVGFEPLILRYDVGFQLSVLATLGLLIISPKIEERLPFMKRFGIFGETAIMTISAQMLVLPLLVYYFHSVSIVSLPVNIIILPLIPALMFLGFIAG